jgi:Cof subfamily protein (haloacid dehalogenase superfamily)
MVKYRGIVIKEELNMIKLIATDLDGTLMYPKRIISLVTPENKKVLADFVKNGGKVVLASGRSKHLCDKVSARLGFKSDYITAAGGLSYVDDKVFDSGIVDFDTLYKIEMKMTFSRIRFIRLAATANDELKFFAYHKLNTQEKIFWLLYGLTNGRIREPYQRISYDDGRKALKTGVFRLTYIYYTHTPEIDKLVEDLKKRFSDKVEIHHTDFTIEITSLGYNKGTMLEKIVKHYGLKNEEVLVVGDGVNDISMLKRFKNSIAMEHGREEVKKEALSIIKDFKDIKAFIK